MQLLRVLDSRSPQIPVSSVPTRALPNVDKKRGRREQKETLWGGN